MNTLLYITVTLSTAAAVCLLYATELQLYVDNLYTFQVEPLISSSKTLHSISGWHLIVSLADKVLSFLYLQLKCWILNLVKQYRLIHKLLICLIKKWQGRNFISTLPPCTVCTWHLFSECVSKMFGMWTLTTQLN